MFVALLCLLLVQSSSTAFRYRSGCTDRSLRLSLPAELKSKTITIVTDRETAPFISGIGNGVPFGFDVDLMNYIGYIYRINFQYRYAAFADFIPIVQNDSNTISIEAETVTEERSKLVTFAQFFKTGSGFLVRSSYSGTINQLTDLCGKTVAVQTGTIQEQDVQQQNKQCSANPITILSITTYTDLINVVDNGTATVAVSGQAGLLTIAVESNNRLKVIGDPYNVQPYGILCNKKSSTLCCALVNAINHLIQEGVYGQLLKRYSFSYKNNGICPSRINLNGSFCKRKCRPRPVTCNKNLN